jgi:hypothetical protein
MTIRIEKSAARERTLLRDCKVGEILQLTDDKIGLMVEAGAVVGIGQIDEGRAVVCLDLGDASKPAESFVEYLVSTGGSYRIVERVGKLIVDEGDER